MHTNFTQMAAAAIVVVAQLVSLPADAETSEVRDLAAFDAIEVSGAVELVLRLGSELRVEVSSDGADLANLVTEVVRGTLRIRQEPRERRVFGFGGSDDYVVDVTLPELRALDASGGTDVRVDGAISGERLAVDASGAADVTLTVDVTDLEVNISGGSDLTLTGYANRLEVHSSGGSDLAAGRLAAASANVRSSGGSDVMLQVTERLVARASGGSDVVYRGDPPQVDVHESGGADIKRR
jgi:hypothetical protein